MFINVLLLMSFLFIFFLAYRFRPKWYKSKDHMILELGCQGHQYKRIIQIGYLILGSVFTVEIVVLIIINNFTAFYLYSFLLGSLSFIGAGVFSTSEEKNTEAKVNHIFSILTYVFIVIGMILYGVHTDNILPQILFVIPILVFETLINVSSKNRGIYDRILYLLIAIWVLLYITL